MKKVKIQIKHWSGSLIFEYGCKDNTIYKTLKEAVKNGVNLYGADLCDANLRDANLRGVNLRDANLRGVNLRDANLRGADLYCANLRGADLYCANLRGANLRGADLRGADLCGADLCDANLRGVNLRDANLRGADLYCANLRGAKNIPPLQEAQTIIVPEGDLIGWKKCKDDVIVKLLIPEKAKRSNSSGRKCRAEYVKVLEIFNGKVGISQQDEKTEYKVGKIVKCNKWDKNRWNECSGGIHFFITRIEAENY